MSCSWSVVRSAVVAVPVQLYRSSGVATACAMRSLHLFSHKQLLPSNFFYEYYFAFGKFHGRALRFYSVSKEKGSGPEGLEEMDRVVKWLENQMPEGKASRMKAEGEREKKAAKRHRWPQNPWEVKRKRFTRHMLNLVRKEKVEEAEEVFEHLLKGRVHPNEGVYNTLIAGVSRSGEAKKAFKLFNDMKKRAILPTDHTYTSMFTACAKAGPRSLTYLTRVQDEVERRGFELNLISTNALLSALVSCGQLDAAFEIYQDRRDKGQPVDVSTIGALLLGSSQDTEQGLWRTEKLWGEMAELKLSPDLHCYNLTLSCLRDSGVPEVMSQNSEETTTLLPFVQTSSGSEEGSDGIDGASSRKKRRVVARARSVVHLKFSESFKLSLFLGPHRLRWLAPPGGVSSFLKALSSSKLEPDIRTFHLLASLTLDQSDLRSHMTKFKISPDKWMTLTMMRIMSTLGDISSAEALLKEQGLQEDQQAFQAIAIGINSEKKMLNFLEEMKKAGLQPNEYVFGALVGSATKSKCFPLLTAILKQMKYAELPPNETILQILDAAANMEVKSSRRVKDQDGFRGYYTIWKRVMCEDLDANASEQLVVA